MVVRLLHHGDGIDLDVAKMLEAARGPFEAGPETARLLQPLCLKGQSA